MTAAAGVIVSNVPLEDCTLAGKAAFAAKAYHARKWRVIPVNFQSKVCHIPKWQNYVAEEKSLASDFADPCNIGVLLEVSKLTDVDIDSADAVPFLDWLPATNAIWGRPGNPHSHHLYRGRRTTRPFKNAKGMVLEIRSHGCYAVLPPSVHPAGEPYAWESDGEPGEGKGLEDAVIKIAIAATLLPAWKSGIRHALALATAGLLLKAGWTADAVADLVIRVAKAAGDTEIADRKLAVQTTVEGHEIGASVAGFSKLMDLMGKQDAKALASWVNSESHDLGELASTAKSVKAKRHLAENLLADLASRGVFYRTSGTAELLYFHKQERELYALESLEFRALCGDLYGINGKEPVWSYIEERVHAHCLRHGAPTEFFQFARYQNQKLYVHAGGNRVLRLDGVMIDAIDNGDDGILFKSDPVLAPIEPDYAFTGSPVREHLVDVANAIDKDRLALYEIYIYTLFFESILPTKPIVLFTGVKGSGKTSTGRSLKRALHGPTANVDTGMGGKEDAFWAAICHSSLVCIDNVDALVPWLADALAVVATGGTFKRRKLYETNTLVEYVPRCFTMLTSRNPQSFTRDDVVDRLLLIEVERRKNFIEESHLLAQLDAQRGRIWGELLTNLNKMVGELKKPAVKPPLLHRLADWARLAIRFAPLLGIADVEQKLTAMEASKVEFALDDQPLVQGLEEWVAANPEHEFIASGDLFQAVNKLYDGKGQKWAIKNARAFGVLLRNLRLELETRYKIEDKPGPANKKLFRFTPLMVTAGQQAGDHTVEELAAQL